MKIGPKEKPDMFDVDAESLTESRRLCLESSTIFDVVSRWAEGKVEGNDAIVAMVAMYLSGKIGSQSRIVKPTGTVRPT